MVKLRGGMISLIYKKMLTLPLSNINESGAMSIVSSDVETLAETFHLLMCDIWAHALQFVIATWLLAKQVGAVCVAPIIVSFGECRRCWPGLERRQVIKRRWLIESSLHTCLVPAW